MFNFFYQDQVQKTKLYFCHRRMNDTKPSGWQAVEALMLERFGKIPDMEGILFLIGINEYGKPPRKEKFTKEQKQDLMHIAVCTLLSQLEYYEFIGRDEEGWPHFENKAPVPVMNMKEQESLLKACMVHYFGVDE